MDESVRVGVDVGGTFTDVVLVADGSVTTAKVPTTDEQSEGVLRGIERACEAAGVEPSAIDRFRHATTVATNAVLEGTGAETALVTTAGFRDVLAIGRQDRPALYDLSARRPEPLVPREHRYELAERAGPEGIERAVEPDAIDDVADRIARTDVEAVAVVFLHAYAHPDNEQTVADRLRDRLDATVVASHETLPTFREYERTATTVADAYVRPVVGAYLSELATRAADRALPSPRVMQSTGGVVDADRARERAVTTLLSGPAAGTVGAGLFERDGAISLDMGGTSCDVGLIEDGEIARTTDATVAGHPVRVPMVEVETVGAGGGSIAWVDDGAALRVGPRSAGADPGPACYGRGGTEPTVTDAAVVLGYLGTETALGGDLRLDSDAARKALAELATAAGLDGPIAAARGVYRVTNARMTRAIRRVTVERGHDPREFELVAFGGAGPMHAAALADALDVGLVRVPRANGVLSALGLLAADERHDRIRTRRERLDPAVEAAVEAEFAALTERLRAEASRPEAATVRRQVDLRYAGQSHELTVPVTEPFDAETATARFHERHERTRGYRLDEPIDLVNLRVTVSVPESPPELVHEGATADPEGRRRAVFDEPRETPVYDRRAVRPGLTVSGPAIFEGGESTIVVPPDRTATVGDRGTIVLRVDRGTDR